MDQYRAACTNLAGNLNVQALLQALSRRETCICTTLQGILAAATSSQYRKSLRDLRLLCNLGLPKSATSREFCKCTGTFLRGTLEKVGVDPNIKRIGKYKSAGDQLLRKDMSEAQREQLTAILDDLYEGFTEHVAASRGKTAQEVRPAVCAA